MIYSIITIFIFSLSFQFRSNFSKFNDKIYPFVLLGLFLFTVFRYEIGCDWKNYQNMFNTARDAPISFIVFNRDPLFWIALRSINILNLPFPAINIFSGFLFFIGINALAKRQPNPLTFLVLIFPILIINMPMSAIRQGAAIGMICYAIIAIIDKRPKHFLLWVSLATGFHISSVVFLLTKILSA